MCDVCRHSLCKSASFGLWTLFRRRMCLPASTSSWQLFLLFEAVVRLTDEPVGHCNFAFCIWWSSSFWVHVYVCMSACVYVCVCVSLCKRPGHKKTACDEQFPSFIDLSWCKNSNNSDHTGSYLIVVHRGKRRRHCRLQKTMVSRMTFCCFHSLSLSRLFSFVCWCFQTLHHF